jgi:hypothetical protein
MACNSFLKIIGDLQMELLTNVGDAGMYLEEFVKVGEKSPP